MDTPESLFNSKTDVKNMGITSKTLLNQLTKAQGEMCLAGINKQYFGIGEIQFTEAFNKLAEVVKTLKKCKDTD